MVEEKRETVIFRAMSTIMEGNEERESDSI